jgi:hypothetical protein
MGASACIHTIVMSHSSDKVCGLVLEGRAKCLQMQVAVDPTELLAGTMRAVHPRSAICPSRHPDTQGSDEPRPVKCYGNDGASRRRQFHHPVVAEVGDVEIAGGVHRNTVGGVEAGEG